MNERFIVIGRGGMYEDAWGAGETIEDAKTQYRKAGGTQRKGLIINRFTSELPFAPYDREATPDEADAYVSGDGSTCWIRCERETVEPAAASVYHGGIASEVNDD